jgi:fluoride exporter
VSTLFASLIGVALGTSAQYPHWPPEWRLFVMMSFLGGLTTFFSFSAEAVTLLQQWHIAWAAAAAAAHVAGSLLLTLAGLASVHALRR